MDLILVRHAEAEDAPTGGGDDERQLTGHGRKVAAAMAQGLALCVEGRTLLWTSPLPRARQTAERVAHALEMDIDREHDAIAVGDLDALHADWRSLARRPDTLILVGHQPHLGLWAERLTGVVLPIKKASAVAMHLGAEGNLAAKLLWYAHPDALANLGRRKGIPSRR